jgi:D-alanine-D-alanine ligase
VDFRVAEDGVPLILEINTNPCISPDAGFAAAAEEAGMNYGTLIEKIVQAAP